MRFKYISYVEDSRLKNLQLWIFSSANN